MLEEVRYRTETLITEACQADQPVIIEAPPASGKTYNAIRLAAQGYTLFSRLAELRALVPLAGQKRICTKTALPSARG